MDEQTGMVFCWVFYFILFILFFFFVIFAYLQPILFTSSLLIFDKSLEVGDPTKDNIFVSWSISIIAVKDIHQYMHARE